MEHLTSKAIIYVFQGGRQPFVIETVKADDNAKLGMLEFPIINYHKKNFLPFA